MKITKTDLQKIISAEVKKVLSLDAINQRKLQEFADEFYKIYNKGDSSKKRRIAGFLADNKIFIDRLTDDLKRLSDNRFNKFLGDFYQQF